MTDKLVTKPFQNLLCEACGKKVNVSTGEGYWRVDPSNSPWKVLGWHTDCKLAAYEQMIREEGPVMYWTGRP